MGFGDVHILTGIGAHLGFSALLPVVLLAAIQGTVAGVVLLLLGRATRGTRDGGQPLPDGFVPPRNALPFGPFLALGAVEWLHLSDLCARALPAFDLFR